MFDIYIDGNNCRRAIIVFRCAAAPQGLPIVPAFAPDAVAALRRATSTVHRVGRGPPLSSAFLLHTPPSFSAGHGRVASWLDPNPLSQLGSLSPCAVPGFQVWVAGGPRSDHGYMSTMVRGVAVVLLSRTVAGVLSVAALLLTMVTNLAVARSLASAS